MILWPWAALAGFALMAFFLKAWQSKASGLLWLRTWLLWGAVSTLGALISARLFQHVSAQPSVWVQRWGSPAWQTDFWFISSFPFFLVLALDFKSEASSFRRSQAAFLTGAAAGPLMLGAFPLEQVATFLAPFVILTLLRRALPRKKPIGRRALITLALLNGLGLLHGIFTMPPWLGFSLLAACLAAGLNPYAASAAAAGTALALCGFAVKLWLNLPAPASIVLACFLITAGWILKIPPAENDIAQTA